MTRSRIPTIFFFLVLFFISIAFLRLIYPFFVDIIVAAILANIFNPVYKKLNEKFKDKKPLASGVTVLLVFVIVIIPLLVAGTLITGEAAEFLIFIKNNIHRLPDLSDKVVNLPLVSEYQYEIQSLDVKSKIGEFVNAAAKLIISITQNAFLNVYKIVFNFFIVIIVLFFFFINGNFLVKKVKELFPLKDTDEEVLIGRFKEITEATIKGTLIIAVIEGAVGGGLLAIFGIPSPVIWAMIMMILSMIPIVGTNIILVPAALFKLLTGHILAGFGILIFGVGFVIISQNIIKPKLVGDKSRLHPAIVLLATLGGLSWLGLIGFIIGPVIAALFISIWYLFGSHYKDVIEQNRQS
jgi:predicted PurR-regulated permease PerM